MKIEKWKLKDIKPYFQNAKLHNVEWIKFKSFALRRVDCFHVFPPVRFLR